MMIKMSCLKMQFYNAPKDIYLLLPKEARDHCYINMKTFYHNRVPKSRLFVKICRFFWTARHLSGNWQQIISYTVSQNHLQIINFRVLDSLSLCRTHTIHSICRQMLKSLIFFLDSLTCVEYNVNIC